MEGDRVSYHNQSCAENGQIVIAQVGEEVTIKKMMTGDGYVDLVPINPEYQTRRVKGRELSEMRIYGVVISSMRL